MNEISELAKIIDSKLDTLKRDDIIIVVFLPAENMYILKALKEFMYKPNTNIIEIGPFTRVSTYTDILRTLDNALECFKFN